MQPVPLRLSRTFSTDDRRLIWRCFAGLPRIIETPVSISAKPRLTAYRGKLLSNQAERGKPIYAASFIRSRRIVIEEDLLENEPLLRLILVHEWFHFLWPRLGNQLRRNFASLLAGEFKRHARGELGESSKEIKESLLENGFVFDSRAWRYYVCESFCDTAAWYFAGVTKHSHFCLAPCWMRARASWFEANLRRYTDS